jgi:bifunctional enzyme CysN/CysC
MGPLQDTAAAPYRGHRPDKDLLRFVLCGSVDDGKSTLIGRLLYDANLVFEDQLDALAVDSRKFGTQGDEIDLALLVDGLAAEREQGITIDVAYRYFSTEHRRFIVADVPGHEQYTRNMVTGASTADAAVLLIDAGQGVKAQTRRHAYLARLLGVQRVALAVNKLDNVGYRRDTFARIDREFRTFASGIGITEVSAIPVSALKGDNVVVRSRNTPWYQGPTLLSYLEELEVDDPVATAPFRLAVQWVNRPGPDFRGYCGRIASGSIRPGDPVVVLPSGRATRVARLPAFDGDLEEAVAGQSVTVVTTDEIDASRGDVFCAEEAPAQVADQFEADVVWMDEEELLPGRRYVLKIGATTAGMTVLGVKHRTNVDSLEHVAARTLRQNEVGVCTIGTDRPLVFDSYASNRATGGFIVIDRRTGATAGAGMLHFALRRAQNVSWQSLDLPPDAHSLLKGHQAAVVWLTGISGAGKSTLANLLERRLFELGVHTCLLDGDNLRHGLSRDLGFTTADRVENIRRAAEVAKLMVDAGLVVLIAMVSPFEAERRMARDLIGPSRFCEVFVDTPLEVAEARDRKGLYAKARRGELVNFTGIDSPYEVPENPEVRIDTATTPPEAAVQTLLGHLRAMGTFSR